MGDALIVRRGIEPKQYLNEQIITPNTINQIINGGSFLKGNLTILGDANLLSENIKEGITIFNVLGTMPKGSKVASGTITLTSSQNSISIEHGLGQIPSLAMLMLADAKGVSASFPYSTGAIITSLSSDGVGSSCVGGNFSSTAYVGGAYQEDSISPYSYKDGAKLQLSETLLSFSNNIKFYTGTSSVASGKPSFVGTYKWFAIT